jgi:large subunit ribosomal protein L24
MKKINQRNVVAHPHVRKGDLVEVLAGDDRKRRGKVLQVLPKRGRALVEGLNLVKKHMRKSQDNPQGGIVEQEASIALSNLKPIRDAAKASAKSE